MLVVVVVVLKDIFKRLVIYQAEIEFVFGCADQSEPIIRSGNGWKLRKSRVRRG